MSPPLVLSLVLGSIYGLLCHAFVGQRWRQVPLYWSVGVLGFFAGAVLAVAGGRELLRLGTVPLVEATFGSCVALGAVAWLARRRARGALDRG